MEGYPKAFLIRKRGKDKAVLARYKAWATAFRRWQQLDIEGVKAFIQPVY